MAITPGPGTAFSVIAITFLGWRGISEAPLEDPHTSGVADEDQPPACAIERDPSSAVNIKEVAKETLDALTALAKEKVEDLANEHPEEAGATFITGLVLLVALVIAAQAYVRRNWDRWLEAIAQAAFEQVDINKDGSIDRAELHAGVLLMYSKISSIVRVQVPDREHIFTIMGRLDVDKTGSLGYEQFKEVMLVMSGHLIVRALMQLAFTMCCPFVAGYLVHHLTKRHLVPVPVSVQSFVDIAPPTLCAAVISSLMMSAVPPLLRKLDLLANEWHVSCRTRALTTKWGTRCSARRCKHQLTPTPE